MGREDKTLQALVAGGLIGAALGAILSKDKEEGGIIGALLGAAFTATLAANEEARKTNVPVYIEEDNKLYAILPGGEKKFIKDLVKPKLNGSTSFKLK